MKKIIDSIFPYNLYLQIFQLEHYDIKRFLYWLKNNFFVRFNQNKKPLVVTQKIRAIITLSIAWFFFFSWLCPALSILFIIQPWILIVLALFLLKPYEILNRYLTIQRTAQKIKSLNHVQVIGIAGSYGKTSVKDILYHILRPYYRVLKTPLSYNTIFGIAQVIDLELDNTYNYFLCELGEFQKGDIKEMCEMVLPSHGIITGINDQHLERFKTIENTTATIFELADYLNNTVANTQNPHIAHEIPTRTSSRFINYGDTTSQLTVGHISFSEKGTCFNFIYKNTSYQVTTPLLGSAHLNNILGAATMALTLGVSIENIIKQITTLPHVPHRYDQSILQNNLLLIDNSYSSNSDSFKESLNLLSNLPRKTKIFVTPGMVELGKASDSIHAELGRHVNTICTKIILVGNNERTRALATSINSEKIIWMDRITDLWKTVDQIQTNPNETVVLLENDLPDNY